MTYLITVVVPDHEGAHANERVLATRSEEQLRSARGWIDRNQDTFRLALEDKDTHFEAWVQDDRGAVVLHVRHAKALDTVPQINTREQLKAMNGNRKRGWR